MSVIRTQCRSSQVEFYRHAMLSSRKSLVSLLSSPRGTEGEAQQAAASEPAPSRLIRGTVYTDVLHDRPQPTPTNCRALYVNVCRPGVTRQGHTRLVGYTQLYLCFLRKSQRTLFERKNQRAAQRRLRGCANAVHLVYYYKVEPTPHAHPGAGPTD